MKCENEVGFYKSDLVFAPLQEKKGCLQEIC